MIGDGAAPTDLGGSHYLKVCHGKKIGPPPHVDLVHEIEFKTRCAISSGEGLVKSAHDCSEGGFAVALAECCFNPERLLGAEIDCPPRALRPPSWLATPHSDVATLLFNESQSRIIISISPNDLEKTLSVLRDRHIPFQHLGKVGGNDLRIHVGQEHFSWPVADLHDEWWNAIRRAVEGDSSPDRIPSL